MSRKKTKRKVYDPSLPRGLRPKLQPGQVFGLELFHMSNLDAIARGEADKTILQQYCLGCYMWAKVAELLGVGLSEMADIVETADSLLERYRHTARIEFIENEYETARVGVDVMSALSEVVDTTTLLLGLHHSERLLEQKGIVDEPMQRQNMWTMVD